MQVKADLTSKSIPVINGLRGLAASMVCIFHFVVPAGYIHNTEVRDFFDYGKLGVYIFFVISGVVIPLSMIRNAYGYRNWGTFMMKRTVRLEPPYLATIVLALIYFQVRKLAPTSVALEVPLSLKNVLLHLGYLVPFFNGEWILKHFWTLGVEFQYYLILSLLLPFVSGGNKIYRYCFYLIFLGAPFLLSTYLFIPVYAPVFLVGILYALWKTDLIESREYFILTLLCIAVGIMTSPMSRSITALLTILVINFFPYVTNSVFEFLGKISYSLYLLHPLTGKSLINVLSYKYKAGYQVTVLIIAGYILSVISAYVFYRIVEKPFQRLSGKIKYNRTFIPVKKQHI
ncbi:hypothetical protein A4H97_10150 [Niastella yeongjuensis]|uniref:Acyltransferase 3 domain-containing protein n=1 Tax=Niastella yeongjuensis TaxID=354355 RepID=A0A1V9EFL3_9BACT|nr:hypothetical protein A4H97_10150 [Niastella yeongjuensis]